MKRFIYILIYKLLYIRQKKKGFIMIKEYEKEYEELLKLGENAGILELMKFYGGYDEYLRESQDFFKLTHPEMGRYSKGTN